MGEEKSKILIIGATGYIGKYLVEASAKAKHPTFVLVRSSSNPDDTRLQLIHKFNSWGVTVLYGDINDHESLVSAVKQVDVVISAVGAKHLADQLNIISAIKQAGTIKRFFPSEFGNDVKRIETIEPVTSIARIKVELREVIKREGIPYTFVSSNGFFSYFVANLVQGIHTKHPPRDKVTIFGDGTPKAVFVKEEDIATYTINAVDDPRTLNKVLHMRPPANTVSFHELVSLWEKKINKTLEKSYILEDQLLNHIQDAPYPEALFLSLMYSYFVRGDKPDYEIDERIEVEASQLYPAVNYTTIDQYLDQFV